MIYTSSFNSTSALKTGNHLEQKIYKKNTDMYNESTRYTKFTHAHVLDN